MVSGSDAFIHAQPGALLVVVDTNRPDMVESQQLLDSCNRVAVIDHHRRAATYIESAALNFHEPYASSASELVTELLQYLVEPSKLLKGEAEALHRCAPAAGPLRRRRSCAGPGQTRRR